MKRLISFVVLFAACCLMSTASAHYLWVKVDGKGGKRIAHVIFEEGPLPRDGRYLDPFVERGQHWVQTPDSTKPVPVKLADTKENKRRWLSGPLDADRPLSFTSYGKFGVYAYGKTNVLLHYYAQYLDVSNTKQLATLGNAEHLKIHMVPKLDGNKLELQVLWQGKPAAGRPIYIRGPKRFAKTPKTDAEGKVAIELGARGRYLFRTYVELDQGGEDAKKAYQKIRHHFTLNMIPPSVSAE